MNCSCIRWTPCWGACCVAPFVSRDLFICRYYADREAGAQGAGLEAGILVLLASWVPARQIPIPHPTLVAQHNTGPTRTSQPPQFGVAGVSSSTTQSHHCISFLCSPFIALAFCTVSSLCPQLLLQWHYYISFFCIAIIESASSAVLLLHQLLPQSHHCISFFCSRIMASASSAFQSLHQLLLQSLHYISLFCSCIMASAASSAVA